MTSLKSRLSQILRADKHPDKAALIKILADKTSLSSSGYPYISESSFQIVLHEIPHLFADGERLLTWISRLEKRIQKAKQFVDWERESVQRGLRVLRNIVYSAAICAPPDLWVVKHVLSAHFQLGLMDIFRSGTDFAPEELAGQFGLDLKHLNWDLSLLHCRGYLSFGDGKYRLASNAQAKDVAAHFSPVSGEFLRDMVDLMLSSLKGNKLSHGDHKLISRFLTYSKDSRRYREWPASGFQLEVGYRLVPMILALHVMRAGKDVAAGTKLSKLIPRLTPEMTQLLTDAGITRRGTELTDLGLRVLNRGPGPFGIIHAYVAYMQELQNKLSAKGVQTKVNRGKNIAASQDANRKTFEMANDSLDRFCTDFGFQYPVFIEHALGQGEAIRQRLQRSGEHGIQYFGADLEDAAIDRAIILQQEGLLPRNMIFIRRADIGNPYKVVEKVREAGFSTEGAVMFVGNGFHEIRGQSNQKIINVFQDYCKAGIVIVFTEESALGDNDLVTTGWNTYHAGFRYVHELSGQGLRPVYGTDKFGRYSWRICASLGGYAVLLKYCARTRTIYPHPRKGGYNPPISMTYFCVPADMARSIGCFPTSWGFV